MGNIYKYTKTVYTRTGSGSKTLNVVGSAISLNDPYQWINSGGSGSISGGTEHYNAGFFNAYSTKYYFDEKTSVNYLKYLLQGTGLSQSQFTDILLQQIEEKLAAGAGSQSTYNMNTATDAGFESLRSKEQGMFGYSANGDYWVPVVTVAIQENTFNPSSMTRNVTIVIVPRTESAVWNDQTHKWSIYGGYGFAPFSTIITGQYTAASQDGIRNCLSRMANVNLALGQGAEQTNINNVITFTSYRNNSDRVMINIRGDRVMTDNGYGNVIYYHGNTFATAGNWNASSTIIDPVDPNIEPDPYDPVPPPPKPPGPGPDPTPIDDPVPIPGFPPIDGVSVGIYKAYRPSSSQLRQIASQLWNPTVWAEIKQMFTNPMEAILGLAIVPVNPTVGASLDVYLGRYNTQVSVPVVASDYVTVDCGSVAIKKFYGSYLDHDPYTKYTIYLPYIGEMELNADEITGRVMNVVYHCNVITGDVVALVALDGRVCYTGMGNFIRQLPLSQTDYSSIIQTAVSAASAILTTAVAGAGGAAVAGAAGAESIAKVRAEARVASTVANGTSSLLSDVLNAKFNYKHSGKIGQGAGQIGVQKPFITINRPNLALPENNNLSTQSNLKAYTGYPCNKIVQLSSCHGFTQIEACKLSVPGATDEEVAEIYSLLKGGVLL